jgi:GDP-L-fucose synthase
MFWEGKKVLVTGGAGFIGSHLVEKLIGLGSHVRVADNLEKGNLNNLQSFIEKIEFVNTDLTQYENCEKAVKGMDIIMHLAAKVGGVGYNISHPATMYERNVLLNTLVLDAAKNENVERYLCTSSACVYPRYCTIPTPETEGFEDEPEVTNRGYGWAKRMAELQAQFYKEEYGMKIAIVRPYNAYGPRATFNLEEAHVIPSLIKKTFDTNDQLVVWGNGEQSRAFVYVKDIVNGMILATEKYAVADPLNIGTDEEIKIKDLANLIVKLSGKTIKIIFDSSKPAGQPRRNADITKAKKVVGYKPEISLEEGLKTTIDWYRINYSE